jgi:hypothetical protein
MTTHDYPGESTDQMSADPSWQRQADEFVVHRGEHDDDRSPGNEEASTETSLFAESDRAELRREWDSVQAGFVDNPKQCVEQADGLVSNVVSQLSNGFAEARSRLEQQWGRGEEASTEDLRVALKRYREFFDRLLAV